MNLFGAFYLLLASVGWACLWTFIMLMASTTLDEILACNGIFGKIGSYLILLSGGPVIWILAFLLFRHCDPEDES